MKLKKILLALILTTFLVFSFVNVSLCEIDMSSYVDRVIDGDTFETTSGNKIRLADIDAPEYGEFGYYDAIDVLMTQLYDDQIQGKAVYLDIDDIHETDIYGRLVCVVYVDFNSTHLINVNEVMLLSGYAVINDYNNQFDPHTWSLFVPIDTGASQYGQTAIEIIVLVILLVALGILCVLVVLEWQKKKQSTETQKKRPLGLSIIAILWLIGGIITTYLSADAIREGYAALPYLENPLLHEWFRIGIPVEIALSILGFGFGIIQIFTIFGLWIGKSWSYKLALSVPLLIVFSHVSITVLYLSAPPEYGIQESLNWVPLIFSILFAVIYWSYLRKPHVRRFLGIWLDLDKAQKPSDSDMQEKVRIKEPFFCRYCGKENKLDAVFCEKCGRKITDN